MVSRVREEQQGGWRHHAGEARGREEGGQAGQQAERLAAALATGVSEAPGEGLLPPNYQVHLRKHN